MENIIYEILTKFVTSLVDSCDAFDILEEQHLTDLVEECKEIVIDDCLKIVDDYIESLETGCEE